jgi:hypothetical protein
MKIKINQTEKVIPKKFAEIKNIGDYLTEFKKKRLQPSERKTLNKVLAKKVMEENLKETYNGKLVTVVIGDRIPVSGMEVQRRDGTKYHVAFSHLPKHASLIEPEYNAMISIDVEPYSEKA